MFSGCLVLGLKGHIHTICGALLFSRISGFGHFGWHNIIPLFLNTKLGYDFFEATLPPANVGTDTERTQEEQHLPGTLTQVPCLLEGGYPFYLGYCGETTKPLFEAILFFNIWANPQKPISACFWEPPNLGVTFFVCPWYRGDLKESQAILATNSRRWSCPPTPSTCRRREGALPIVGSVGRSVGFVLFGPTWQWFFFLPGLF